MKLKFVVGYRTQWGQNVYVTGSAKELGKGDARQAVKMQPSSGDLWTAEVAFESTGDFTYHYFLRDESGQEHHEFGEERKLQVNKHFDKMHLRDYWRPQHAFENSLYTAPFTKAFFARGKAVKYKVDLKSSSHFVLSLIHI